MSIRIIFNKYKKIILIILLLMIFISLKYKKKYDFENNQAINNTQNEIPPKVDNFGKNDTFNISSENAELGNLLNGKLKNNKYQLRK